MQSTKGKLNSSTESEPERKKQSSCSPADRKHLQEGHRDQNDRMPYIRIFASCSWDFCPFSAEIVNFLIFARLNGDFIY